ncbi:MAG: hypothetical protein ABIY70_09035 [Capsulimonas sp.]|uniref:hypothetical protein n=1 Tax=Capsulimonas sp. TaxID=2494211 RepID=UPI00326719EC
MSLIWNVFVYSVCAVIIAFAVCFVVAILKEILIEQILFPRPIAATGARKQAARSKQLAAGHDPYDLRDLDKYDQ